MTEFLLGYLPVLILLGIATALSLLALVAFFWTLKSGQYDDPEGDARRILLDDDELPPQS